VTVAVSITLTPAELDIPERWTLQVSAQLSAPAPTGGVTLALTLDDPALATIQPMVFIPAGQTLTGPIDITGSTAPGTTTLRASAPGLAEGTATVNIVETPRTFLEVRPSLTDRGTGFGYYDPAYVGVGMHILGQVRLEAPPPIPVDVIVSVPAGSGVLLSASRTEVGSETLVVETEFTSTSTTPRTSSFYVQGIVQGDDVNDDVPVTIDVVETGTTNPVGYEQSTDRPSNVDVGPSGFVFNTGNDLDTTTLSLNENVPIRSWLLYDEESNTTPDRWQWQEVRGGHTITVDLSTTNPAVGDVIPAIFTGGNEQANAQFDPLIPGTTDIGSNQPTGHTTPTTGNLTRTVTVDAPDVTLERFVPGTGWQPSPNENIGRDLQVERRIRLEVAPPAPGVNVTIEVIDPTVALISKDPSAVGSAVVTFPLVTGTTKPLIYLQGLTLDQGTELRVTAPAYDQWITTVQIVDAGFQLVTNDFTTNVDASNRTIRVRPVSLDALRQVDEGQLVRGGTTASVDVLSSDAMVGAITLSPLVFTGADEDLDTQFDPLAVGTTTISISQPPGFLPPAGETAIVATVEPS
jgi:hypothetical protein